MVSDENENEGGAVAVQDPPTPDPDPTPEPDGPQPSTYVVQRAKGVVHENEIVGKEWTDFATITVPARTKRPRVIEMALENADPLELAEDECAVFRVLDAPSAELILVRDQVERKRVIG